METSTEVIEAYPEFANFTQESVCVPSISCKEELVV